MPTPTTAIQEGAGLVGGNGRRADPARIHVAMDPDRARNFDLGSPAGDLSRVCGESRSV